MFTCDLLMVSGSFAARLKTRRSGCIKIIVKSSAQNCKHRVVNLEQRSMVEVGEIHMRGRCSEIKIGQF